MSRRSRNPLRGAHEELPAEVPVGPLALPGRGEPLPVGVHEAGGLAQPLELARLEPEPEIGLLLAERLILVGLVVEHHHRAARARLRAAARASSTSAAIARAGTGAWCSTREAKTTSAPASPPCRRAARTSGPSISPRTRVTLPSSRRRTRSAARASWASARSSAITALEDGRRAPRAARRRPCPRRRRGGGAAGAARRRPGTPRAPAGGPDWSGRARAREELPRGRVARADDLLDASEGAVRAAGGEAGATASATTASSAAPAARRSSVQVPCRRAASEPGVAQGGGVARDSWAGPRAGARRARRRPSSSAEVSASRRGRTGSARRR